MMMRGSTFITYQLYLYTKKLQLTMQPFLRLLTNRVVRYLKKLGAKLDERGWSSFASV